MPKFMFPLRTSPGRSLLLSLLLAACAWPGARAQDMLPKDAQAIELWREVQGAVRLASGLEPKPNQLALRDGQALTLSLQLPRAGYLNVLSINAKGEPTVLFPNQLQSDNQVAAGSFSLPTPQMPFELRASAPYGPNLVAVFLTTEPLNLYANGDGKRNAAGVLLGQFARLSSLGRGLLGAAATKNLVVVPSGPARPASAGAAASTPTPAPAAPLLAGMVTVNVCAATGPCESPGSVSAARPTLLRVLDAMVPGIFLDPVDKAFGDPGQPLRPVVDKGILLTKVSEGFVPRLYEDAAGYCTIAYGHLMKLGRCGRPERAQFPGNISEPEGGRMLVRDMEKAQRAVMGLVKVPLTDGQFAALTDFTFNVGAGKLQKSTLLKAINANQHARVPFQLRRWVMAGGRPLRGLQVRREREIALYFEGRPVPKDAPADEETTPLDVRRGEP